MKKAFTMTEALIIIGIVGILAVLSIVAVSAAKPDKDIILFKKSYMTTQKVIKELLSDKDLYPSSEVIALNFDSTKLIKSMTTMSSRNCNDIYKVTCFAKMDERLLATDDVYDDYGNSCATQKQEYTKRCSDDLLNAGDLNLELDLEQGACTSAQEIACYGKYGDYGYLTDNCTCLSNEPPTTTSGNTIASSGTVLPIGCRFLDETKCTSDGGTWNSITCKCTMPEETEFDFTKNEISVIGKGFADTDISAEQRQKFPFLRNVNVSASNKFAVSFANRVNTIAAPLISANTVRFGTPDGIVFSIEDHFNDSGKYADITVYLKKVDWSDNSGMGECLTRLSNETCSYNASTCKAPTKFLLRVEANGKVKLLNASNTSKIDAMACSYLRYPKINKRSKIPTSSTVNTCFAN